MTRSTDEDAVIASFGLTADATSEEVASARACLDDFLATAPPELRSWADLQKRSTHTALDSFEGMPSQTSKATKARSADTKSKRRLVPMLGVLVALGVVIGVYFSGNPATPNADAPAASPTTAPTANVDQAEVTRLMGELAAKPKDTDIMRDLGKVYYAGGDFVMAGQWQERILEIAPDDVDALLALGVAKLNAGDLLNAEKHWNRVIELKPDMPEVYYNLGFLYLSKNPPENEKAEQAWAKVLELAPDSSMAGTVKSHLEGAMGGTAPNPEKTP